MQIYHLINYKSYEPCNVALAQGLHKLGHFNVGDVNYWQIANSGNYLINANEPNAKPKPDIILVSYRFLESTSLPNWFKNADGYKVLIDDSDGGVNCPTKRYQAVFDLVLKCHFNRKHSWAKNVIPWQFGIPEEISDFLTTESTYIEKGNNVEIDFRSIHQVRTIGIKHVKNQMSNLFTLVSISDSVHDRAKESLDSSDQVILNNIFRITAPRHNPSYLARKKKSKIAIAFGGWFEHSKESGARKYFDRLVLKLGFSVPKSFTLCQFDSWRLWESFFAGNLVIAQDFSSYDCEFPINPVNGVHYLGIDLITGKIKDKKVLDYQLEFSEIAKNGQRFVIENYSNIRIAERLLVQVVKT